MSEENTPIEEVYTPTELNGELVIAKREDGSGGNLTVEGDFNLSGKISRDNIHLATVQEPGAVIVGNGLSVSVAGLLTPEHPKAGEIYLDYLQLGLNTTNYDRTDTAHPIHAAAGYNLGEQASVNWFNTHIKGGGSTILLNQLPTTSEIVETVSDGDGPSPTSEESNLLPTSGAVVDYVISTIDTKIAGLDYTDFGAAAETHTHALSDLIYDGSAGYTAGTTISANSTDGDLATGKAVYDYVTAQIAGIDLSTCAPAVHTHTLSAITDAGTAARLNAGTGAGNVPVLDGAGKLSISMMPERVIGGEYLGEVADEAAMIAKSTATVGDFVKRTDTGTYWMLGINSDGAYATAANWFEYAGAVASVNGATGQVTQAQLGLETTLTTTSDVKFPSSKAVATYVSGRLGTLTLGDIHANPNTVFTLAALPNGETYQLPTLLKVNDLISTATNGITVTSDKISDLLVDASEIDTGAGYAVSDYAVSQYVAAKITALNLGEAATKNIAASIGLGQTGVTTGAQVYLYIDGLNLANTYAPKSHHHPLTQIYAGGNMTLDRATSITSASTDYLLATGKAVYDYAASKTHTHPLSFIVDNSNVAYSAGTSITSASTDNQLATAKAVYDTLEAFSPSVSSADISDAISTADGITDSAAGLTQGKAVKAFAEGLAKKKLTYLSTGTIPVTKSGQAFIYSVANGVTVTLDDSGLKADGDEIVETTIYLCGADEMTEITTLTDVRWKNAADNIPVLSLNQIVEIKLRRVSGFWLGEWEIYSLPSTGIVWVTTLSDATEHTGTSLRDAITSATAGDKILFNPELNGSIVLEQGTLEVDKNVTIDGSGRIEVDGNETYTVFTCGVSYTTTPQLHNLFISNGFTSSAKNAGGIYASGYTKIKNCKIASCTAQVSDSAGGVCIAFQGVTIDNTEISNCEGVTAGGIQDYRGAKYTNVCINGCFSDSSVENTVGGVRATGGGMYFNCQFIDCSGYHGAFYASYNVPKFSNCQFLGCNGSSNGSSVVMSTTAVIMNNCIINDCSGLYTFKTETTGNVRYSIINCSFIDNEGPIVLSGRAVNLYNSIIYNSPNLTNPCYLDVTNVTEFTASHCLSDTGTWADLTYDPTLPLFEADGYTPCAGSQLIDAGDSTLNTETTDLNGNPRVVGEAIDIGAIEFQGA